MTDVQQALWERRDKTAAAREDLEPRDHDYRHCERCDELTVQYAVYWFTHTVVLDPPVQPIPTAKRRSMEPIRSVEATVSVWWCVPCLGEPKWEYDPNPPVEDAA